MIYHLSSSTVYLRATLMTLNFIFPFQSKTGSMQSLKLMAISSEFVTGALIFSFKTHIRRSLCYTEVVKCFPNSLKSVYLCWERTSYQQKSLKILAPHLIRTLLLHDHILKTVSSCMSSLAQISRVKHV